MKSWNLEIIQEVSQLETKYVSLTDRLHLLQFEISSSFKDQTMHSVQIVI